MDKECKLVNSFNLVSPELPAGVAWLVNCLLELGVPIWNPWDVVIPNEWVKLENQSYRYNDPNNHWQQTLPSLYFGKTFKFDQSHSAFVSHRWPHTLNHEHQHILFVRDPRDLLFSQWRRLKHNQTEFELSFTAFANSQYHHFPLTYQEYVLLFLHLWMLAFDEEKDLLLKFEDYRSDAYATLQQVQSYLQLSVSDQRLNQAVSNSDFKVCQRIELQKAQTGRLVRKFNFSGTAFEYKEQSPTYEQFKLIPAFSTVCNWLGYESEGHNTGGFAMSLRHKKQIVEAVYQGHECPADCKLMQLMMECDLKHDWKFLK